MEIIIGIMILVSVICGFVMGRMTTKRINENVYSVKENVYAPEKKKEVKSPLQIYREHKEKEEDRKELERLEIIMENIENYDGTGAKQKDVPIRS